MRRKSNFVAQNTKQNSVTVTCFVHLVVGNNTRNLLEISLSFQWWKKLWKSVKIWRSYPHELSGTLFFWNTVCILYGSSAAERVLHSNFQPGRSQGQSAHLLGESWPTDHQQVHWSVAWQTEGSSSSEWWTQWTVVLNIWFICCHALLCIV